MLLQHCCSLQRSIEYYLCWKSRLYQHCGRVLLSTDTMGNASICTPLLPASPVYKEPKMDIEHDEQWKNIRAIIAAIAIPKKSTSESISQDTTPVDDTASLLLPKVVDSAASEPQSGNAYGTFNRTAEESEHTVVPLHPNSILTSAALTPVYLILMLLPMLPFWIFAGFLCYVAA